MAHRLVILFYLSAPTDLAGLMSDWPEFVSGEGFTVDLKDAATGAAVTVRLIEKDGLYYVVIDSPASSKLFDQVAGRVVYALTANSDYLHVTREH
jgi:hypothetical protein